MIAASGAGKVGLSSSTTAIVDGGGGRQQQHPRNPVHPVLIISVADQKLQSPIKMKPMIAASGAGRGGIIIINNSNSGRWRWTAATASTESRPPGGRVIPLLIISVADQKNETGAGKGGIIIINSSNIGWWRWMAATASTESRPPSGRVIPLLIISVADQKRNGRGGNS